MSYLTRPQEQMKRGPIASGYVWDDPSMDNIYSRCQRPDL